MLPEAEGISNTGKTVPVGITKMKISCLIVFAYGKVNVCI
jgi:hypothetical protein